MVSKSFLFLCATSCFLTYYALWHAFDRESPIEFIRYGAKSTMIFQIPQEGPENSSESATAKKPKIIMWTGYYNVKSEKLVGVDGAVFLGRKWNPDCCREVDVISDRALLEEATAIVFCNVAGNLRTDDLPSKRRSEQLWVFFNKENQFHAPSIRPYNNLFNLTMTYRRDSDIWAPYGLKAELAKPLKPDEPIMINNMSLDKWVSGKTKLMAGVMSHCPTVSRREYAVNRIAKDSNAKVDTYGSCGIPVCSRFSDPKKGQCDPAEVWKTISRDYKFYFAAENAICEDYITEKFWRSLDIGIVPVAYGGGDYEFEAPPGSFIDARDFDSPRDLGLFLKGLAEDPEEYKKYFEWRRKYSVRITDAWQGWCDLCEFVKEYSEKKKAGFHQIHKGLHEWFTHRPKPNAEEYACEPPLWDISI